MLFFNILNICVYVEETKRKEKEDEHSEDKSDGNFSTECRVLECDIIEIEEIEENSEDSEENFII